MTRMNKNTSSKPFFVRIFIVLFVYVLCGNYITMKARGLKMEEMKYSINGNILRQLKTHGAENFKHSDKRLIDITNLSKRTLMMRQTNARVGKYILTRPMTEEKNDEKHFAKRQIIAPGYYEAECSEKKPCKEGKYCNLLYCEDCHKEKMACARKKQCCKGMMCTFGRCEKKAKGDPGTFCEKDTDCKSDACCVLEPTVNTLLPICKPKLAEYHQCASILYRKVWIGEKPDCGPCQQGLECSQKGIFASHQVCLKPSR